MKEKFDKKIKKKSTKIKAFQDKRKTKCKDDKGAAQKEHTK